MNFRIALIVPAGDKRRGRICFSQNGASSEATVSAGCESEVFISGCAAIELAHNISANRPRGGLGSLAFLDLTVRQYVGRTDKTAFDQHVRAFLETQMRNGVDLD